MEQEDFQLHWPQAEVDRLGNRVLYDFRAALADHNRRINRWREFYRRWRQSVDLPNEGEEAASNLPVPYVQWNIFTKWAKEMDSLFGDDAEITAVPVGPSNYQRDKKIGLYMTWRVLNSMKLVNPFCVFVFRKLLFGRSFAFSPWKRDTFEVLDPQDGYKPKDVVDYEGPDFYPCWPDDVIVPAEDVQSIHQFSYVIRRVYVRPEDLLKGEEEGRYQNIRKNWDKIVNLAQHGIQRDFEGEEIKREKDEAEGILYQRPLSSGEWVMVLEWYGRWRPIKKGPRGGMPTAGEWDFDKREMHQREYVVKYLYDLHLVIGLQDLQQLYPTKKNRRPFVEASMVKDGSYWGMGLAEMLINLEDELRVNHNQATEAGQMAMQPPIGYRPASGFNADTFKLEPGLAIPLDNPTEDVKEITITANMDMATWKEQAVLAYGEKLTGMSDLQMGRQQDRPNAPRTARQTVALLEEGNVRISLDTKVLAEDMALVLAHFWDLEYMFAPEEQFFRVTEEDAGGAFPVNNGGSILTWEERDGRYDFRLKFANSVWSREAAKEKTLARYQLDLQNPLVMQNPRALWEVTKDAHEALGDEGFAALVPRPPAPDVSMDPKEEWVHLLHGDDDVHVRPSDDDLAHMIRHKQDLTRAEKAGDLDPDAAKALVAHYHDHIVQLQQKRIHQAVLEKAAQGVVQALQGGGAQPLQYQHGLFGNPPSQPPGNPQATGPFIYSGHPEVMHES